MYIVRYEFQKVLKPILSVHSKHKIDLLKLEYMKNIKKERNAY